MGKSKRLGTARIVRWGGSGMPRTGLSGGPADGSKVACHTGGQGLRRRWIVIWPGAGRVSLGSRMDRSAADRDGQARCGWSPGLGWQDVSGPGQSARREQGGLDHGKSPGLVRLALVWEVGWGRADRGEVSHAGGRDARWHGKSPGTGRRWRDKSRGLGSSDRARSGLSSGME